MKRRDFITLLGGTATAWPIVARAQQAGKTYRIGFLGGADPVGYAAQVQALQLGLRDHGHVEGRNTAIEYRWAEGNYNRLPALMGVKLTDVFRDGRGYLAAMAASVSFDRTAFITRSIAASRLASA